MIRSRSSRHARGFTLTEIMMATAVAAIFLTGLIAAFIQVLRTTDRTEAVNTAVANGRVALDAMAVELKQANFIGGLGLFIGLDSPVPLVTAANARYGNGIDNDGDGTINEELFNGFDEDGDWTGASDRHALVGSFYERPNFVGAPDLGDAQIDEDCLFENDVVTFWIVPGPGSANPQNVEVSFSLGDFEGRSNVLLKTVRVPAGDPNLTMEVTPLAQNVLSFSALYWMPNSDLPWTPTGDNNYWLPEWDSTGDKALQGPALRLPAAVHLTVQVHADERPIEMYRPGDPVKVETLSTTINLEQIINDPRFPRG